MSRSGFDRFASLLLRAGLMAGIIAIIAGIFGMHVMSGAHSMPWAGSSKVSNSAGQQLPGAPHTSHPTLQPVATSTGAAQATLTGAGFSCSDTHSCPSMSAMGAVCVLSPANTSLSAPLPGASFITALGEAHGAAAGIASYSYLPGSPSPGELCISRT